MNARFDYTDVPASFSQRNVRLVVEVLDAVTREPIRDGITISVTGFSREPTQSLGGAYVWRDEGAIAPTRVDVDPGRLPYLPAGALVPAPGNPPARPQYSLVTLALAPTAAYPFTTGATGIRGTLIRDHTENPGVPIALAAPGESLRLQWMDDALPPPAWTDSDIVSSTDAAGDFAAIVRLGASQIARTDAQGCMRVRVAATRSGGTRFSPELEIKPGYVTDVAQKFAWDQFTNV